MLSLSGPSVSSRRGCSPGPGELEFEHGSVRVVRLDPDVAAVRFHDLVDEEETEAVAVVDLVQFLTAEYHLVSALEHARAVVGDGDDGHVAVDLERHLDPGDAAVLCSTAFSMTSQNTRLTVPFATT